MNKQSRLARGAGVLCPLFSLPSPYGMGDMGDGARRFIDFLADAGQKYWQLLPLGPTGYGNSPYQSPSAFAGNPLFLSPDALFRDGLISEETLASCRMAASDRVDYEAVVPAREKMLEEAYCASGHRESAEYRAFCAESADWLSDYAAFMTIREQYGGAEFRAWPDARLRACCREAVEAFLASHRERADFYRFLQFRFYKEWGELRAYAASRGISLIGDLPIYVSLDSADVWAASDLFLLDDDARPTSVAGVPPDVFSEDGQLWGNPIYDWTRMAEDGYDWWCRRAAAAAKLYDLVRIDHFIGLVHYYAVPAGETTAKNGAWHDGPGEALIYAISERTGGTKLIAEDLGNASDRVREVLCRTGIPGMRVLQFAFDGGADNPHLPFHYEKNCVAYGGTHDNEPLAGYFAHASASTVEFAMEYTGVREREDLGDGLLRTLYESSADVAIVSMADALGLGSEARINTPGTVGDNWAWRLRDFDFTESLAKKLARFARTYGRAHIDD